MSFTAMVITISDRCAQGQREDASGPLLVQLLQRAGYTVTGTAIVPDEYDVICHALRQAALANTALILTTGGTGFSPRDITPEATAAVCQRMAPGIGEAMRAASLRITPRGMLSRASGPQPDRQPAGQPQGRPGKPGGSLAQSGPRLRNAPGRPSRLRNAELSLHSQNGPGAFCAGPFCRIIFYFSKNFTCCRSSSACIGRSLLISSSTRYAG